MNRVTPVEWAIMGAMVGIIAVMVWAAVKSGDVKREMYEVCRGERDYASCKERFYDSRGITDPDKVVPGPVVVPVGR